jgi:septal ring factor EnvC (AmiA/AmiB activator)
MNRRLNGRVFNIAQLERMLDDQKSKLNDLTRARLKLQRRLEALDTKISSLGGSPMAGNGRARNKVSLNESIVTVLQRGGSAMSVGDIVKRVLARGYSTTSPNFRSIVNQALIKDQRFAKAGVRGSYELKKK